MTPAGHEAELAELAFALGLSYELEYSAGGDGDAVHGTGWVKLKASGSKRYAVVMAPGSSGNGHSKRICGVFRAERSTSPKWPLRDADKRSMVAGRALAQLLGGCTIKVSKRRMLFLPPASCVEELKIKMAVSNGRT